MKERKIKWEKKKISQPIKKPAQTNKQKTKQRVKKHAAKKKSKRFLFYIYKYSSLEFMPMGRTVQSISEAENSPDLN